MNGLERTYFCVKMIAINVFNASGDVTCASAKTSSGFVHPEVHVRASPKQEDGGCVRGNTCYRVPGPGPEDFSGHAGNTEARCGY